VAFQERSPGHLSPGEPPLELLASTMLMCKLDSMPMVKRAILLTFLALAVSARADADAHVGRSYADNSSHHLFSIQINVTGLPPNAEFVPVSCRIDLTEALQELGLSGVPDERALRLSRRSGGQAFEEPFQFTAEPQPRQRERTLLAGTPQTVSYLAEFPAGTAPGNLKVAGELAWIVRTEMDGSAEYILECGVPRTGRSIQVPFAPQNLRSFDDQGRATPVRWFPGMQFRPQWPLNGTIQVFEDGQLVTAQHLGPAIGRENPDSLRRPFLYPLIGPDGISLTEFGKPHDPTGSHAHHYSLWIAHASVNGKDFWSESGGVIAHEQIALLQDGPVFCRSAQRTRWISGGTALLQETRQFTFHRSAPEFRLIDLDLRFRSSSGEAVTFGKTSFGFLAARVAQSMTVFDGGGEIINAAGDRNEQAAHLRKSAWIDQSGPVAQGKWNGISIFDHPQNPNHPSGWHCRNDGWAGAAFNMDGPFVLEPGEVLSLRYRIYLHRHDSAGGAVARRYEEYAAQPLVSVAKPILKIK
jgi:hypothetical protein